jgi:uncharacterized protein with NRDE domain
MCLILLAYAAHPTHRLIVLANRDEHYSRPTAPLDFWPDHPQVLAGRDLEQHGTWMGVTRTGRLAAITNYRAPHLLKKDAPSRGHLVSGFLLSDEPPAQYLRRVVAKADAYNGFNLIVGDSTNLFYYSNIEGTIRKLEPGIYGLSNHLLDTPWPKVQHARQALAALVNGGRQTSPEAFLKVLQNRTIAADEDLPDTGVGVAWERMLSPAFISSPTYGTRSSTLLRIDSDGRLSLTERTWVPAQSEPLAQFTRHHEFMMQMS